MKRRPQLSALALAALLSFGLFGCGGGSDSPSTSASAPPAESRATEPENAEESIESFGSEASGSERDAILAAFHDYLEAIARRDYDGACALLSQTVRQGIEQLVTAKFKDKGCAFLLSKLLAAGAAAISAQQAKGEVTKVRFEGDRGFVVFKAPGAKLYQLTMEKEGDEWKAGTGVAAVLVPELP